MNTSRLVLPLTTLGVLTLVACPAHGQDWPQWRGPDRAAKAVFTPPATWPQELKQQWKVTVGDGVATPALVGDKLYVFSRQDGQEVLRCLNANTGAELWAEQYEALGASGAASSFSGPRCTPTIADGKVVTFGVRGVLVCRDAATGKQLWRKEDFAGALPRFFTSASPIVADGLCVAQVGGPERGGIVAYALDTGETKWQWTSGGPAYASPSLLQVGGKKYVVALTDNAVVAVSLADGKTAWQTPFVVQGRGYNAASPMVDGQTVIYSGSARGTTAVKFDADGEALKATELWRNDDASVMFNSPVLARGHLYGLTARNELFCLSVQNGLNVWTAPFPGTAAPAEVAEGGPGGGRGDGGGRFGGRGGRGGGGGGGAMGYGSIVDAGSVLLALTPASQLVVFEPGAEFKEVARVRVASSPTYAYPVPSGKRIFIKDQDSVILYSVE